MKKTRIKVVFNVLQEYQTLNGVTLSKQDEKMLLSVATDIVVKLKQEFPYVE